MSIYSKFDNGLCALQLVKVAALPEPVKADFEKGNWHVTDCTHIWIRERRTQLWHCLKCRIPRVEPASDAPPPPVAAAPDAEKWTPSVGCKVEVLLNDGGNWEPAIVGACRDSKIVAHLLDGRCYGWTVDYRKPPAELAEHCRGAEGDGWIMHDGTEKCPVPDGTPIQIKWRNGRLGQARNSRPEETRWSNSDNPHADIAAYRILAN